MDIKQVPTVKIKIEKAPEHRTHPVSGVWGGATPQGDILCHFFVEHLAVKDVMELEFDIESGKTIDKNVSDEKIYVREILTSLLVRPDIAMSVGKWLISKAEAIKKSREMNVPDTKRTIQ